MNNPKKYASIKDLSVDLYDTFDESVLPPRVSNSSRDISSEIGSSETIAQPNTRELALLILQQRSYINSRSAYPICEVYLNRLRAIAKIADIPITNVTNNIFALFFDDQGVFHSTHDDLKTILKNGNAAIKEYLTTQKKQ